MNHISEILRWVFTAIGAIVAILEPTLPYLIICTLMIFADCFTAWQLSKRARKAHPERVSDDGKKFKSQHFGKVIMTVLKAWALIIMAFLMQKHITDGLPIDLTKVPVRSAFGSSGPSLKTSQVATAQNGRNSFSVSLSIRPSDTLT